MTCLKTTSRSSFRKSWISCKLIHEDFFLYHARLRAVLRKEHGGSQIMTTHDEFAENWSPARSAGEEDSEANNNGAATEESDNV